MSSTEVMGMRCVMRSFFAKPPVSINLPVGFSGLEIGIRIPDLAAFTLGAFGKPPGGVSAKSMLSLQPLTPCLLVFWARLLNQPEPFLERAARFLFKFRNPFLGHCDAGVNAVDRFLFWLSGGFRHK